MTGNVTTCSLSTMKNYDADLKYFIVHSPGKVKTAGLKHRPDLAPSTELFLWAQTHKHEAGWFDEYAARFRREMAARKGLSDAIEEIKRKAQTQAILLVCFCPDAKSCHRSLIAETLITAGIKTTIE